MISDDDGGQQVSYWPSISDLFMTLFITAIALVGVVFFVFLVNPGDKVFKGQIKELRDLLGLGPLPEQFSLSESDALTETIRQAIAKIKASDQLQADVDALSKAVLKAESMGKELQAVREKLAAAEIEQARLISEVATLREQQERSASWIAKAIEVAASMGIDLDAGVGIQGGSDKPPFIDVPADVLFPSGGSIVSETAASRLDDKEFRGLADEILKRNAVGLQVVDTLEIIGHTDGVPMKGARGNLDSGLPAVLSGAASISGLRPGSNNDLGLLRALAIKRAWQDYVATHPQSASLRCINVRTYSAGQTIPFDPLGPVDDERARRIELRLTNLQVGFPPGCALSSATNASVEGPHNAHGTAMGAR
jgi:flagellar motor protein MotB